MMPVAASQGELHEIRRYPNRRLYDVSQSKTVTLEELYRLVAAGDRIQVTETASGEDITARVLTQMILDLDSAKLELFPAKLLHRVLQTNENLVREFVDTYFDRALELFVRSKDQFTEQWRHSMGPGPEPQGMPDWIRAWWPAATAAPGARPADDDLREMVEDLRRQVGELQRQVAAGDSPEPGSQRTRGADEAPA